MGRVKLALVGMCMVVASLTALPSDAMAQTSCHVPGVQLKCRGDARYTVSTTNKNRGDGTNLYVPNPPMSVYDPWTPSNSKIINQALWVGTSQEAYGGNWIEAGIYAGGNAWLPYSVNTGWYVGQGKPGAGFVAFATVPGLPPAYNYLGQWVNASITNNNPQQWSIFLLGTQVAQTAWGDHWDWSLWGQTGGESTHVENTISASGSGTLAYMTPTYTWQGGWPSSILRSIPSCTASWYTVNVLMLDSCGP